MQMENTRFTAWYHSDMDAELRCLAFMRMLLRSENGLKQICSKKYRLNKMKTKSFRVLLFFDYFTQEKKPLQVVSPKGSK